MKSIGTSLSGRRHRNVAIARTSRGEITKHRYIISNHGQKRLRSRRSRSRVMPFLLYKYVVAAEKSMKDKKVPGVF